MINPTVALGMIAKDKADIIERALESTKGVFDFYSLQDTGSTDNTVEIFENWCNKNKKPFKTSKKAVGKDYPSVKVDGKDILGNFAEARNDSFKLFPKNTDYGFWLDTDDILENPEQIKSLVAFAETNNVDACILEYVYAEVDNFKLSRQERERLLNLRKKGSWKGWVHENYVFDEPPVAIRSDDIKRLGLYVAVKHLRSAEESLTTNRRNKMIMDLQIKNEGIDKVGDEVLANKAYDHWEHKEFDECISTYEKLLTRYEGKEVGKEYIFRIFTKIASSYLGKGKNDQAMAYIYKAVAIMPELAEGYLELAKLYAMINVWDEVIHYADKAIKIGMPSTTAPINEYELAITPRELKLRAFVNKGLLKESIELCKEILQIAPQSPVFRQQLHALDEAYRRSNFIKAVGEMSMFYQSNNLSGELDRVIDAIPLSLKDDNIIRNKTQEIMHDFKRKSRKLLWEGGRKKSIAIYAGAHYETWDGESDVKKGIGGSEGMCIQLSRELAKLGNKVVVYNECGESDGKEFDGVIYLNHNKWRFDLKCDVFISLRRPDVFSQLIKAKKQFLWLHDTEYGEVPALNFYSTNNVIVLSDYHKQVIKLNHGVFYDEIFWVSRNGLNAKALEEADAKKTKRDQFKMIWTSSYDRGLEVALGIFEKIKQQIPEATFDIYYGWGGYDKMTEYRQQHNPAYAEQMERFKSNIINKIANTDGVRELGRISQTELYIKLAESSVWFYPTGFQEISCISAMSAQAMGTIPLCTPFAALNETVSSKFGVKVETDKMVEAGIDLLTRAGKGELEKRRLEMKAWAREKYDMSILAKEWDVYFNKA